MLVAFVRSCVTESLIHVEFILLLVIHVWHPRFPLKGFDLILRTLTYLQVMTGSWQRLCILTNFKQWVVGDNLTYVLTYTDLRSDCVVKNLAYVDVLTVSDWVVTNLAYIELLRSSDWSWQILRTLTYLQAVTGSFLPMQSTSQKSAHFCWRTS